MKNENLIIHKGLHLASVILAIIVFGLAVLILAREIQYHYYPEFNQKVFALLDKYFVSHNKEIVLDFREETTETIADDNSECVVYYDEEKGVEVHKKVGKIDGIEFEHTYKIDGTNVIIKTSVVTDENGMAQSNSPTEKEILERLEEYLESYR